jgi:PAS domain S-box-containing protein
VSSPAPHDTNARRATAAPTPDLYRRLVETVTDYAIFALDPDGYIMTWSDGAARLKGYSADEIIGRHFSIFYPPNDISSGKPGRELDIAAALGRIEDEDWRIRKDGTRFWANVVITALRDDAGTLIGFGKVTRDLTQRRAAEERAIEMTRKLAAEEAERRAVALRESELRRLNAELERRAREEHALRDLAQAIIGAARVPEIMHQISEGALAVSEAAGAYVEQVVDDGTNVEIVATAGESTPPAGQRLAFPGSLTEEIIEQREPVFLLRLEGVGKAVAPYLSTHCSGCSVLVVPLFAKETVLGALVLLRRPNEPPFDTGVVNRVRTLGDLASIALQRLAALSESERRRAEAEAAVRGRDEVLSIVSHDLRNPLATVSMSASLLRDSELALTDAQRRQQLEIIGRSAQRMNRLIQDLLDVARIEGGRFIISCRCEDANSLAAEVCDAFRSVAADKGLRLDCEAAPALPRLLVDRDRIVQVLSNFLNNAVKFTPAGGQIGIRATTADGGGVRFAVTDTGPGISAEQLPHVFNRFWQAKRTAHLGSGLGLAIAHGIAEAHRGRVWAESRLGEGSAFYLELPSSSDCS